jgi:hypothetical protein
MFTFSEKLRIIGAVVFGAGLSSLPAFGENPARQIWAFSSLIDLGLLARLGLAAMVLGAILFGASFLVRR